MGPRKDQLLSKGLGAKYVNPTGWADTSLPRLLPTEPEQGDPGSPREHSQVQLRAYITRKVQGNEASPRLSWKIKCQIRHLDQYHPRSGKLKAEAEPNTRSPPSKFKNRKIAKAQASGPMGKRGCMERSQEYEGKLLEES